MKSQAYFNLSATNILKDIFTNSELNYIMAVLKLNMEIMFFIK